MINIKAELKETTKKALDIASASRYLKTHDALVGIPQEASGRGDSVTNAELLFIHTNGSPLRHIPARPVIEPAVEAPETLAALAEDLKQAALSSLHGNASAARAGLERAGMRGETAAKAWFTGPNGWPSNKASTLRKKRGNRPLIDTGAMRKAITHVVREK